MSDGESMNRLRFVSLVEILKRAEPLLHAHWEEVAPYKEIAPLKPMWEQYARIEAAGRLILVAVERQDALIGYASYIIAPMQHHATTVVAQCDTIYISPEHRHGMLTQRLLKFCEAEAARRGAHVMISYVNIELDFGPLLEFNGYRNIERVYAKVIGRS